MKRRLFFAALMGLPAQPADPRDEWRDFAAAWNPFAAGLNKGLFDIRLWKRVRAEFRRIEKLYGG